MFKLKILLIISVLSLFSFACENEEVYENDIDSKSQSLFEFELNEEDMDNREWFDEGVIEDEYSKKYCGSNPMQWQYLGKDKDNRAAISPKGPIVMNKDGAVCAWDNFGNDDITYEVALLKDDGEILLYKHNMRTWELIDDNPSTKTIIYGYNGDLFQVHFNGKIWKYMGNGYHSWKLIDSHLDYYKKMAASNTHLYQLRGNHKIYGCSFSSECDSGTWKILDDNPATDMIAAGKLGLYQVHQDIDYDNPYNSSHKVWEFKGGFRMWNKIDDSLGNIKDMAVGKHFWQMYYLGSSIYGWDGSSYYCANHPYWYGDPEGRMLVSDGDLPYIISTNNDVYYIDPNIHGSWTNLGGSEFLAQTIYGNMATVVTVK